jgi:ribonuclease HII
MPAGQVTAERLQDPLLHERGFWSRGFLRIAGVDEVGRGPLAGPVVAAAVILPPETCIPEVTDSKQMRAECRERMIEQILGCAVAVAVGAASVREIDRLNIRVATALAMRRAVEHLRVVPDHLLVDGLPVPELGRERHTAIIEGDRLSHCIACASVVAKVVRDRLMIRLARRYPVFGWERNKGYATREHLDCLARSGPTPHHRASFSPVSQLLLGC